MKCEICKKEIGETIANKIIGTYIKDEKGKLHAICNECQSKQTHTQLLSAINN